MNLRSQSLDIGEIERIQQNGEELAWKQQEVDDMLTQCYRMSSDVSEQQLRSEYRDLAVDFRPEEGGTAQKNQIVEERKE